VLSYPNISKVDDAMMVLQAHISLERLIPDLGNARLVHVDDLLVVNRHFDPWPDALDLHDVPLRRRLDRVDLRRHISIERSTAMLVRFLAGVVKELDLIGIERWARGFVPARIVRNGADADAAVALGRHAIFHVQDKIRELTLVIAKEAIAFAGTAQKPVPNRPDRPELAILVFVILSALRNPAVQVFAIEELETPFLLTLHETV